MTAPTSRLPFLVAGPWLPGAAVTVVPATDLEHRALAGGSLVVVPPGDDPPVGVLAKLERRGRLADGRDGAVLRLLQRARLGARHAGEDPWVEATPLDDARPSPRVEAEARELRTVLAEIAELRRSRRLPELLATVSEPGALADAVTAWAELDDTQRRAVLDAVDVGERVGLVLAWARDHRAELQVADRIRTDVTEGLEKRQREFLLREQLAAIRRELGEDGDDPSTGYRARLEERPLPDAVRAAVAKEIERLERTSAQSPEQAWIRTWLDRVLDLPWGEVSDDQDDLVEARRVLDDDHHGLDDVKERIVEFLAVRQLRRQRGTAADGARRGDGAIVLLAGPPGVGKTSLGESVARAMGRRFVRVALGGVRDEAEVRGHRRTYVGAQPGRIARAITEAGTMNPVVLLDEVDKLSPGGWSGDPTAALLEVLDPAQNHTFRDHYLEVDLDLSDVVFLATANVLETVPGPLLDRMEVVRLDGYTEDEKVAIARRHLLPRQELRHGLLPGEVDVDEGALRRIVTAYTREAGVRGLERQLGTALRKVATRVASGAPTPVSVDAGGVAALLGRPRFHDEVAERVVVPGVATGLAVTGTGGDVLFVEASAAEGDPGLTLTGQLGDVMKESAQIALSYVKGHAVELGITGGALDRRVHVHVPAGAVPKDGPSAGVTMVTALVSLLTGRPVSSRVGMTGEVTLRGRVLPIGGVKQKVLAAHRAGLTDVVLPARNGPDLEDVPERVREAMTFHLAETVDDVLAVALEPAAEATVTAA